MFARICAWIFAWWLLAAAIFPAIADQPFSLDSTPGQLPKTVVPHRYALRLEPDSEKFINHGSLVVDIEVREPVREILLNALDMKISRATLSGPKKMSLKPASGRGQNRCFT